MGQLYEALRNGPAWEGWPGAYSAGGLGYPAIDFVVVLDQNKRAVEKIFLFGRSAEDQQILNTLERYPHPTFDVCMGRARNLGDIDLGIPCTYFWDRKQVVPEEVSP